MVLNSGPIIRAPAFYNNGTRYLPRVNQEVNVVLDDILLTLGTDQDIALVNRSTILAANTALTGVLIGTPVSQALAANSVIIANKTADGDLGLYVNDGGNSLEMLWADGSAGTLTLGHGSQGVAVKTAAGNITINAAAGADVILGDDVTLLALDGAGRIGIGGSAPAANRAMMWTRFPAYTVTGDGSTNFSRFELSWDAAVIINTAAVPILANLWVSEPGITENTGTVTAAVSLYVEGPPTEGDNNYSVWVDAGDARFDGTILSNGGAQTVVDASGNVASANGHASFGPADATSFTVVNGIITAIS